MPPRWSVQPSKNMGDGIKLGRQSGAVLPPLNTSNGIYAPASLLQTGETTRRYLHFSLDRTKPGSFIVGPDGHRFFNEAAPYQEFVQTMMDKKLEVAYFIGDKRFLQKYGMGMALPWPYPVGSLIRQGYLIEAPSISKLAEKINVPAKALESTVSHVNAMADTSIDEDFKRGGNAYDKFYGDPSNKPNPNLGKCEKGPFYALKLYPGHVSTMFGLNVDEESRVLGDGNKPIEGLYAVGCDQNSLMMGIYPGGGSSIGPGMTFGFKLGFHLAGQRI
jgi:succinate dehydrogenase/fumarate reductase flavoprotein subunit